MQIIMVIVKVEEMTKPKGFIRRTKQRELILQALKGTKCHPTADWVYEKVREQLPSISLGTVYRNLRSLVEAGEVMELTFGSSFSRFDGNPENHYHFVCEECGQVSDLDLPLQEQLEKQLEACSSCKVYTHRLEFYGVCEECLSNG
jgi:Fur family peroxide stress response transcriptional regulator